MKKITSFLMMFMLFVGMGWAQEDGVYKLFGEVDGRGFLTYSTDYPNNPKLSNVTYNKDASGFNSNHLVYNDNTKSSLSQLWYLYTSITGKKFLFELTTGKMISFATGTTNVDQPVTLVAVNAETSLDVLNCSSFDLGTITFNNKQYSKLIFKDGDATRLLAFAPFYNKDQDCVRMSKATPDGGMAVEFQTDQTPVSDVVITAIKEVEKKVVVELPAVVGYPNKTAKDAYAEAMKTVTSISDINTAKNTFLSTLNVVLPENGKFYYIISAPGSGINKYLTKNYYNKSNKSAIWVQENKPEAVDAIFACSVVDGKYCFRNADGGYLGWATDPDNRMYKVTLSDDCKWDVFSGQKYNGDRSVASKYGTLSLLNFNGFLLMVQPHGTFHNSLKPGDQHESPTGNTVFWKLVEVPAGDLDAALQSYKTRMGLMVGTVGGVSKENYDILNSKTSLKEAVEFVQSVQITFDANKLYRIKNYQRLLVQEGGAPSSGNKDVVGEGGYLGTTPYPGYKGVTKAVSCGTNILNDAGTIWKFIPSGQGYRLFNLNTGSYLGGEGNKDEKYVSLQPVDSEIHAGTYKMEENAKGLFRIGLDPVKNKVLHPSNDGIIFWDDGKDKACLWHIEEATELEVALKVSDNRSYTTLHVPFAVGLPETVKAYTGTVSVKEGQNVLIMHEQGRELPANTGVVLKDMNAGTKVSLNILNDAAAIQGTNNITGTNVAKEVEAGASNIWIFSKKNDVLGFYHYGAAGQGNKTLGANKAYVEYNAPVGVNGFRLDFGDITGIEGVETEENVNAPIYDLSGRRVLNTVKGGIYIQNGKKFIVR